MSEMEPWLTPNPAYVPTQPVGVVAPIPVQFRIKWANRSTVTNDAYAYGISIVNELRGILGPFGELVHVVPAVPLDEYLLNSLSPDEYPRMLPGRIEMMAVMFRIEEVWRQPARENAYVYTLRLATEAEGQPARLVEILDQWVERQFEVLAWGVDNYLSELAGQGGQ